MKNLLKIFVLIAILFSGLTETIDAQTRSGRSANTTTTTTGNFSDKTPKNLPPSQVLEDYINHEEESNFNCVSMTIATNEVYRGKNFPISTWSTGAMVGDGNSLKSSSKSERFWSNRRYKRQSNPLLYQPFDAAKTDEIEVVLTKVGNSVKGKLIKNGNPAFDINIFGVMTKAQGHIFYGSYGTHGGFVAISVFKIACPQ